MSALDGPAGRLRTVVAGSVAALVVVALVVTLLVTRLAGGSDGAEQSADPSTTDRSPSAAAQRAEAAWSGGYGVEDSSNDEVARAIAGGAPPTAASDFPRLPPRCLDAQGVVRLGPCPILSFGSDRPTLVLWGDSHAEMYLPAAAAAARAERVNLTGIIAGGCPPTVSVRLPGRAFAGFCQQHNARALTYLRTLQQQGKDFRLVLNAFWSGYRLAYDRAAGDLANPAFTPYTRGILTLAHNGTEPLFRTLGEMGIAPDVLAQAATVMPKVAPCAAGREPYRCDIPRDEALYDEASQRDWMQGLMALAPGGRYIDPSTAYCDDEVCHSVVDGVPTFWDDLHLGKQRTSTMAPYFAPSVEDLAG